MKTELIEVIKKTIHVLENDLVHYDWTEFYSCNCGVLIQQATNIRFLKFRSEFTTIKGHGGLPGPWSSKAKTEFCSSTGIPTTDIFKKLKELGLNEKDIMNLEFLSNEKVRGRANLNKYDQFHKKDVLIKYLKAWAELLEEEQKLIWNSENPMRREIKIEREILIVEMDEKARKLPKEIVYN
jgi:hypothetical protein